MADAYLSVDDLTTMTEFDFVKDKTEDQLQVYVTRAHIAARSFGPFPTFASLASDSARLAQFKSEMKMALFLMAEALVLANPARPMEAAGITQERLAQLNLSRAEGGGRSGKTKSTATISDEVLAIFRSWSTGTTELLNVVRTDVFEPTHTYDINDPNRHLVTMENVDDLSLTLMTSNGDPLWNPDQ